jgi:adenine-specific DNA-methyltransferase
MPTLDWIGKKVVINHHNEVPFHLLKEVPDLSVGEPGSGNLLVEGDNLLALKALLPYYAGQVKCIYIDPPYNTGNEAWIYNDNVNSPEIRKWLGKVVGGEMEDLSRHDKWLCMMYPRLSLLRELLRDDGAIFISIDDNEVTHLRNIMDAIFGRQNFIANAVWQKVYSPRMDAKSFSNDHDHIVIYARSSKFQVGKVVFEQNTKQFSLFDEEAQLFYRRRQWRKEGSGARRQDRPNLFYPLNAPDGVQIYPMRPDGSEGRWRGNREYYEQLKSKNQVEWIKQNSSWQVYIRQYSKKGALRPPSTIWFQNDFGHNHEAAEEIKEILGSSSFPTPKPTRLIQQIVRLAADKDSLILDSFAGSGTTGHAVMQLNRQDSGKRRFILVEMDSNICRNVTAERLRRVCLGYEKQNGTQIEGLGGGFRYCKLGEACFDEYGEINPEVTFSDLARHVFFTETGEPLPRQARANSPLIGVYNGMAVYLLYNGILQDKRPGGGNVLTQAVLSTLPKHDGPKVIYGAACRLSPSRLKRQNIVFKQIPYEIRGR